MIVICNKKGFRILKYILFCSTYIGSIYLFIHPPHQFFFWQIAKNPLFVGHGDALLIKKRFPSKTHNSKT